MDKYLGGGHWLNRGIIWKCFGVDCDKICRVIRCGDGRKGQSPGENPGMWGRTDRCVIDLNREVRGEDTGEKIL